MNSKIIKNINSNSIMGTNIGRRSSEAKGNLLLGIKNSSDKYLQQQQQSV